MRLADAEKILTLAALAESGIRVEFLTNSKKVDAFVFIEPRSLDTRNLSARLLTISHREGLPSRSRSSWYRTPADALDKLSKSMVFEPFEAVPVSPCSYDLMREAFDACEYQTFETALRRVRDELEFSDLCDTTKQLCYGT